MEISEWHLEDEDNEVHLQCSRLAFFPVRFMMKGKVIDSWQQASATTKHRERLASVLFGERVSLRIRCFDDGQVLVYEMTPFAQRYVKPRDDRIKTRQHTFPGIPSQPVRMPVETRPRWGDNFRQTYVVNSVVDGSKSLA
jgi:hypothetical protein